MKSVARLKEQARRHEQREEWAEAVRAYEQVIQQSEEADEDVDLMLYNRVGDLHLRLGRKDRAVEFYEKAADRYAEAELFNNAIALCNKVLRYRPGRSEVYLKLGRFSDVQGFIADARRNFLIYADAKLQAGDVEAVVAAWSQYEKLSADPESNVLFADRLEAHGNTDAAVRQLARAYALWRANGSAERAQDIRARVLALDPGADLDELAALDAEAAASGGAAGEGGVPDTRRGLELESVSKSVGGGGAANAGTASEELDPLPLLDPNDFGADDDAKASPLGGADSAAEDGAIESIPLLDPTGTGADDGADASVPPLDLDDLMSPSADAGKAVEAGTTQPAPPRPDAREPQAAAGDGDGYIDLASLLFDDDAEGAGQATGGDAGSDADDFEALLRPFRSKVMPHGADDPGSRYDLGLAFKEMGLIDEAIAEFLAALDADGTQLKVYEELGQCLMEKNEHDMAARVLARALSLPREDDDGVIGVYYQLGRCHEELGRRRDAREAYERVAAVNAGFQDVAERLSGL